MKASLIFPFFLASLWSIASGPDKFLNARRNVSIIAGEHGYYPETVVVFSDEKVQFFMATTSKDPKCIVVEGLDFFISATQGEVGEAQFLFKKPGNYSFYCPGFKGKGKLVVLGRDGREYLERSPASFSGGAGGEQWVPRDY